MVRMLITCAALLLAAGCSTTSVMHSGYRVPEAQRFTYEISNTSEMSVAGLAELRNQLDRELATRGLAAGPNEMDAMQVDVRITNYYMRNSAARLLVGVMAGRDNIRSTVTVKRADGQQMGHFEVESYNSTAWGTSSGLVQKHAEEVATRIAGLKTASATAPSSVNAPPSAAAPSMRAMKYRPKGF